MILSANKIIIPKKPITPGTITILRLFKKVGLDEKSIIKDNTAKNIQKTPPITANISMTILNFAPNQSIILLKSIFIYNYFLLNNFLIPLIRTY